MATNIQLEVVKAKRLPQNEFDPMPPSASISITSYLTAGPLTTVDNGAPLNPFEERFVLEGGAAHRVTRTCKHSCAPFFSEKLEINVEDLDSLKKPRGVPYQPLPPVLMASAAAGKHNAPQATTSNSNVAKPAFLAMEVTVLNHNENNEAGKEKVEGPRAILFGVINIPLPWIAAAAAGQHAPPQPTVNKEVIYNVALSEEKADLNGISVMEDDPSVTGPVLIIRYKAIPPPPLHDSADPHADVMLQEEPQLTGAVELVRENSQYVWYNMIHDRKWQMAFTHQMLQQWPKLPKTVIADASKAAAAFGGSGRRSPPTGRRSSSAVGVGLKRASVVERIPSYKSISDLMTRHWSVRRSHQALTKIRLCAERFNLAEDNLFFPVEMEAAKKVEWRERQVMRLGLALKSLEGLTSTSPVRILLDKMWLNMVYGVRADSPTPPVLSFEMKHKLQTIAFQPKHAKVLQACLLQQFIPGSMSFAEATAIAEADFDPNNIQYVAHRSSLVGGEYVPTEGLIMAFGKPVEACEPRPKRDIVPLKQIDRLLESTAQTLVKKALTPAQRRAAMREQKGGELEGTARNDESEPDVPDELPAIKRTGQQLFTTVLVDFLGRLLDTMTDHEFMLILQAAIPAVTAAAEKCLMATGGLATSTKKPARRGSSAARKKKPTTAAGSAPHHGTTHHGESGPIVIDHLDELGRRKPKIPAPPAATPTTTTTIIEE